MNSVEPTEAESCTLRTGLRHDLSGEESVVAAHWNYRSRHVNAVRVGAERSERRRVDFLDRVVRFVERHDPIAGKLDDRSGGLPLDTFGRVLRRAFRAEHVGSDARPRLALVLARELAT